MQTAVNPETGEILVLSNNQWIKPEQVAKNDKGESAYLVNNKWVIPGQNTLTTNKAGISDALSDLGDAVSSSPEALAGAFARLYQGNDVKAIADEQSVSSRIIKNADEIARKHAEEKGAEDSYVDFMGFNIKRSDVRNLPQNIASSIVSMGSGILGGIGTGMAGLVTGPGALVAGKAGQALASGAAAYRMDTNAFLREFREGLNEESKKQRGIPISNGEFLSIAQSPDMQAAAKKYGLAIGGTGALDDLAQEHGLYEAGFEGLGNTLALGAGKYIFKQAAKGKIIKPVLAGAGELAGELATETPTQIGQQRVESKAGLTKEAPREWSDPEAWKKSFNEVAGPTALSTLFMAGAPQLAGATKRALTKKNEPTVETPPIEEKPTVIPPSVSLDREKMMAELEGRELPKEDLIEEKIAEKPVMVEPPVPPMAPSVTPPITPPVIAPTQAAPPITPPPAPPTPAPLPPMPLFNQNVIEQNRNRSTPASIQQMNKIAANPMYEFVGVDNKLGSGAPIVTGPMNIPANQLGKKSTALGEDGTKIPVQYAVIDASQILPSNNADGSINPNYSPNFEGLRSVVGNGRTAGIQAAYGRNNAKDYKTKLANDEAHGISKAEIEKIANPMLVRVAPQEVIPPNIGDISNISQTLNLSTVEQAKNDANRIDLQGVKFDDNGNISQEGIRGFISAMPASEQANLIDDNGQPSKQAIDRLNAAIFQKAYQDDELVRLAHQAEDSEARIIIKALSEAAPQMANLEGSNEYDLRPVIVQAAQMAVNARRNGISLSDLVKQQDITAHPLTTDILQLFADNARSSKKIAEGLRNIANEANIEVHSPSEDMFGAVQKRSLDQIVKDSLAKKEEPDLFAERAPEDLPELPTEGLNIPKKRHPQVVAAANLVKNKKMSAKDFEKYVNKYMPIGKVDKPRPPTSLEKMKEVLNKNQKTKINPDIKDGDFVGLRMDIKALDKGGSVVTVHEQGTKGSHGKAIGYTSTGKLTGNVQFMSRSGEKSLKVATGEKDKEPQQTIEGQWVNESPEKTYEDILKLLNDPAWTQVSLDPLRHSYFYDRSNTEPVVSATEVLQVGNFILAKDVKYAPKEQFLYAQTEATDKQKDITQRLAQQYYGTPAYESGNISLIRVISRLGNIKYLPVKNSYYIEEDIENSVNDGSNNLKRAGFTPSDIKELLDAKQKIEAEDAKKHETNPFIKFKNENEFSPDVPANVRRVAEQWKKLLGIKQNLYFTTLEDAVKNENNFTGLQRRIAYARQREGKGGFTIPIGEENRVIAFQKSTSTGKMLEIIAHEMGHTHEAEVYNNAPQETKDAILAEFRKWRNTHSGTMPAKELIQGLRAKTMGQTINVPEGLLAKNLKDVDTYWRSFSEWYADQTARWAVTSEKPVSVVEKFFARLGAALRKFYQTLKGQKYLPNETFKQYLDSQAEKLDLRSEDDRQMKMPTEQGTLFAKTSAEDQRISKQRNFLGDPAPQPTWMGPEESKVDNIIYRLQNKQIDTKRVIQSIQKSAGELSDKWNVYLQEELYHGRTNAGIRNFLLHELLPTIKQMDKMGITPNEMKAYLHNSHAIERNQQIAKINPALPDGGSGLTNAQVEEYFRKLDPAKEKKLKEVGEKFHKMVEGTQDILVKSGAETQQTVDAWNKTYKNYVPLMRTDDDFATHPTNKGVGQGVSSRGAFSKRALGSEKDVQDILGNLIAQRERALIRAEKIRVGRALYGLAIQNPNPNFWLAINPDAVKNPEVLADELDNLGIDGQDAVNLMQEPKEPYLDRSTGLETVAYKVNPLARYGASVFPVRVNGNDRYIFFNANDPRAKRMVEALKNMDAEQIGTIEGMVAKVTRWMAAVNTQYNPVFGGINFLRDVQSANFNLSTTKLAGKQGEVNAGIFPAMKGIFSTLRAERAGEPVPNTPMAKLWNEYRTEGGQTMYRDSLTRREEENQLIEEELKRIKSGPVKKAFFAAAHMLSDFNDTIENAIRLSAYKVARENNISKEQATSIAKNLTVNFDRKGQVGARLNSLYAFFNASTQGIARLAETIKGPAGRKIMAGGIGIGTMQAVMLAAAGFDDDDPPEFIKEKNFIIPMPDGKYVMIPYPLGLHFFPNIGRLTTEFVLNGGKNPGKKTVDLFSVAMDAFNPIGNSGFSMQTLAPTIADPLIALEANRDAFGRPIYKEDRATNPTPGYTRSRETASAISQALSEFLNYASGGTAYQKGAISPTADQIDYLAGQLTGGAGREMMKVEQAVKATTTGEELPSYKVPLAGRFYGDVESKAADAQRFYENVTRMANHENEIKGRQKNRENVQEYILENPEARLWQQANNVENQITNLNKMKKQLQEKNAPIERIQVIENQKQAAMKRFNERVKALQD